MDDLTNAQDATLNQVEETPASVLPTSKAYKKYTTSSSLQQTALEAE